VLKWLLVCCFGYTGYKNARFGKIEAHEAINALAREKLLVAKEAAEQRGFRVLHALVDSIYVQKAGGWELGVGEKPKLEIQNSELAGRQPNFEFRVSSFDPQSKIDNRKSAIIRARRARIMSAWRRKSSRSPACRWRWKPFTATSSSCLPGNRRKSPCPTVFSACRRKAS
jgi:hypothetical protein